MNWNLPSFPGVRAFEAAARHVGFKQGSDELHVTPSAISHQVRGLEEFLGAALFHQNGRGVELTPCGIDYFRDISAILDALDASTERMAGVDTAGQLSVRGTPAFASRWLLPRMARFNNAYPEIELQVATTPDPMHFPNDGVDVRIQYGQEPEPGLRVAPFMTTTRFPVCSPRMLENGSAIRKPEDLAQVTLLRDLVGDNWPAWFEWAGRKMPVPIKGPQFANSEVTIRATEEGQGAALGYSALIAEEIADKNLVKLFELETPPKVIYSLSCPEAWTNRPRITAFRNWVFGEAAGDLEQDRLRTARTGQRLAVA
jgi:LysR family glycine cleavage system transcriptional activator